MKLKEFPENSQFNEPRNLKAITTSSSLSVFFFKKMTHSSFWRFHLDHQNLLITLQNSVAPCKDRFSCQNQTILAFMLLVNNITKTLKQNKSEDKV